MKLRGLKIVFGSSKNRRGPLVNIENFRKVAHCRKTPTGDRLTRQGLQTKIFSPRQAYNRRSSASESPILNAPTKMTSMM